MKDRDTLGSLILVIFAFLVCYLSAKLSLWGADGPGDGLFPFMSGLLLGLCGLFLFAKGLLKTRTTKEPGEIDKRKLFVYILALLTYAVVFNWLGFFLATFLYILIMLKVLEKGTWKSSLFVSSLVTGVLFVVFYVFLDVPLPFGILKPLFAFA
jgi:putative tricarboxylic transport membrane protein